MLWRRLASRFKNRFSATSCQSPQTPPTKMPIQRERWVRKQEARATSDWTGTKRRCICVLPVLLPFRNHKTGQCVVWSSAKVTRLDPHCKRRSEREGVTSLGSVRIKLLLDATHIKVGNIRAYTEPRSRPNLQSNSTETPL